MKNKINTIYILLLVSILNIQAENEFMDTLKNRAMNNILTIKIDKINKLNYYINYYIMNFGQIPTQTQLVSIYNIYGIDNAWWPKQFGDPSVNVTYSINSNNTYIQYENIFEDPFSNTQIREMFKSNILLKNTYIKSNLDIIIPLNIETIKFREKVLSTEILDEKYVQRLDQSTTLRCKVETASDMTYAPDGRGGFKVYHCINPNWIRLETSSVHDYFDASQNTSKQRQNNAQLVFINNSTTHSNETLFIDHNTKLRIVK